MARKADPFTQHIINALVSTGYSLSRARMIAYGQEEMVSLPRAKQMSEAPYYISTRLWPELCKKKKR